MSNEFFVPVPWTSVKQSHLAVTESGVRAYGYSPGHIALQIRHYGPITDGKGVPRSMIAHSNLNVEQALKLRDKLNSWLIEQGVDLD